MYCTHQCSEVGYLEGRVVARDTSNFIVPTIDLESCSTFFNMRMVGELGERETSPYQSVHILSRHFIAYSGEFQVEGIE